MMPTRKTVIETGRFYHVLNRSIQNIPIFSDPRQCEVFLDLLKYYNRSDPPSRFSTYKNNPNQKLLSTNKQIVNIVNYCLMPNHFHLTLYQKEDLGISMFMQHVMNSFSHFYNKKFHNIGPLFQGNFKAVPIENIEQLIHLSRYIHLNPVSANIIEKPEDYQFSSYRTYIGLEKSDLIDPNPILSEFSSIVKYQKFVMLQKDYQRRMQKIKNLILEKPEFYNPSFNSIPDRFEANQNKK